MKTTTTKSYFQYEKENGVEYAKDLFEADAEYMDKYLPQVVRTIQLIATEIERIDKTLEFISSNLLSFQHSLEKLLSIIRNNGEKNETRH